MLTHYAGCTSLLLRLSCVCIVILFSSLVEQKVNYIEDTADMVSVVVVADNKQVAVDTRVNQEWRLL